MPDAPVSTDSYLRRAVTPLAGMGAETLRFEAPGAAPKLSVPTILKPAGRRRGTRDGTAKPWARRYQTKLLATDTGMIVLSLGAALLLVSGPVTRAGVGLAILTGGVMAAALAVGKTRDLRVIGVGASEYKKVIRASAGAFGMLAALLLIVRAHELAPVFLVAMPVGVVAVLAGRWSWRRWLTRQREHGHYLSKVVVLGAYDDVVYVIDQIAKKSGAVYHVVGAALDGVPDGGAALATRQVPIVAGLDDVERAVGILGADAVIVAGQVGQDSGYVRELGWRLEESATELVVALSLTNVAGPRIQMRPVEGLPLMHVDLPQFSGYRYLLKRVVDITVSALALILLLPVFGLLACLIRWDTPGNVIFKQRRVCRSGQTFEMFKFRSMTANAEAELEALKAQNEGSGPLFKLRSDPRVTRVGAWMRKYSLDELPQFFNVLRGEMSLVGPRPPLPSEVAGYEGHVGRRLYIKPGLTGLWQINGRSDLSWDESVRLDLYYVENWSLTGDLMIMWRTAKVMVHPTGAY